MKIKVTSLFFAICMLFGCYNPEEDLTSIRNLEFSLLESEGVIVADGDSNYSFVIKLPGIKYGDSKVILLKSTWGTWANDSTSANFPIKYSIDADAYVDTVRLKATQIAGPFKIEVSEGTKNLSTIDLEAIPQFPSFVQIVSDSIALKLLPGNTTTLKAFFFNENGFPSDNTKFIFSTDSDIDIFPREVFIKSSETTATLQISTETKLDTIKIYGEIPGLGVSQPIIDTLKIAITN